MSTPLPEDIGDIAMPPRAEADSSLAYEGK